MKWPVSVPGPNLTDGEGRVRPLRAGKRSAAEVSEPSSYLVVRKDRVHFLVERVDDFTRRAFGCAEAEPSARLISGYELPDRRHVRQRCGARGRGHAQCPQLPASNVLDGRRDEVQHHLHLPASKVGECRPGAAIGHVHQVDASHHLEQFPGDMGCRANPARRHVDLARIGLRIGNEFGNRLRWNRRTNDHDQRHAHHARDGNYIADEAEAEMVVECRVHDVVGGGLEQRVSVKKRDSSSKLVAFAMCSNLRNFRRSRS